MKHIKIKPGTTLEKVFKYLQTGHSLDNAKAIAMWGYIRLSCAINQLRKKGVTIYTSSFQSTDGNTVSFYRLALTVDEETPIGVQVRVKKTAEPYPEALGFIKEHDPENFRSQPELRGCHVEVRTAPDETELEFYFYNELEIVYAQ